MVPHHIKPPRYGAWISNWATYKSSKTIVTLNSFLDTGNIAIELPDGYVPASVNAIGNFWNTTDTSGIDAMIHDRNDTPASASIVPYTPFLTAPDANTPDPQMYQ